MTVVAAVVNVFKAPSLKAGLPSGGGVTATLSQQVGFKFDPQSSTWSQVTSSRYVLVRTPNEKMFSTGS